MCETLLSLKVFNNICTSGSRIHSMYSGGGTAIYRIPLESDVFDKWLVQKIFNTAIRQKFLPRKLVNHIKLQEVFMKKKR